MIKIINKSDMPTKIIKKVDVLEVRYKENTEPYIEIMVEDNTLIIQEPQDEEDLTKFHCSITMEDWLTIKSFIDKQFNLSPCNPLKKKLPELLYTA
jgi:hypothetical protein